jgi:hypothetical protein
MIFKGLGQLLINTHCKTKSRIPFTATINWAGTMNRAIQVTFQSRPSAAETTSVIQACVKLAVSTDGAK